MPFLLFFFLLEDLLGYRPVDFFYFSIEPCLSLPYYEIGPVGPGTFPLGNVQAFKKLSRRHGFSGLRVLEARRYNLEWLVLLNILKTFSDRISFTQYMLKVRVDR
jgi:hypothetical protein